MIMRHIQDKDFDQLFRDRFEHAEIEPSAGLWDQIEKETAAKKKNKVPVYWMAAAVVLLAVSIGLLVVNGDEPLIQLAVAPTAIVPSAAKKTNVPNGNSNAAPTVTTPVLAAVKKPGIHKANKNKQQLAQQDHQTQPVAYTAVKIHKAAENVGHTTSDHKLEVEQKKDVLAMQPNLSNDHLTVKEPKIKVDSVLPTTKQDVNKEVPVLASVNEAAPAGDQVINENEEASKKGINNVGDLVNFVVNKVDKRDQKFLKFKTDEDENSSLVAINIGFIKFNKKHK
jgi:hypothetical protein